MKKPLLMICAFYFGPLMHVVLSQEPVHMENQGPAQRQEDRRKEEPAPFSVPVRILAEPEQTQDAKREQEEARNREMDNLRAQQQVAQATETMVLLTYAQIVLGFVGTFGLLYSLFLNRAALKAAKDAVDVSRTIGQAQVRAYLSAKPILRSVDTRLGGVIIRPSIKLWSFSRIHMQYDRLLSANRLARYPDL